MNGILRTIASSESETMDWAVQLARCARAGDVLCLRGTLGSGKTTFVRGFVRGVGFKGNVMSPTFAIARLYATQRLNIHHLDLFRIKPQELPSLGLEEYFEDPRGVCLIEWPEAARPILPRDHLEISMSHRGPHKRAVVFRSRGPRSDRFLEQEGLGHLKPRR